MEKNAELYNLTQRTQGMIFQAAFKHHQANMTKEERANQPQPSTLMQLRRGYAESPAWMMIQVAEFHPKPLTVELFRRRAVYAAPGLSAAILEMLASEKLLDRRGKAYHLTDDGQKVLDRLLTIRVKPFADFEPIPTANIDQLENLMSRIIESSMQSDDPPGIWCLEHSRNRAPQDASSLAKIIQYASDFNAFRDDAHMAAYGAHDVAGHTWEAFSYVDDAQANSVEALFDKLAYRGFSQEDWAVSLADLAKRGWVEQQDGVYQSTKTGKQIRSVVEAQTDAYFYAPWDCLSTDEFDEFCTLLQTIHDTCQELIAG